MNNLVKNIPAQLPEELTEVLAESKSDEWNDGWRFELSEDQPSRYKIQIRSGTTLLDERDEPLSPSGRGGRL